MTVLPLSCNTICTWQRHVTLQLDVVGRRGEYNLSINMDTTGAQLDTAGNMRKLFS